MTGTRSSGLVAAMLLTIAGALAACDERPQQGERKDGGEPAIGESRTPDSTSGRQQRTPGPPQQAQVPTPKPGAAPSDPGAGAAALVGTWRVRLKTGADEAQGITYTFTTDGRVTVGPNQICRFKLENHVLSIDCTGAAAESASGRLERRDPNNLVWQVGDKTVLLERLNSIKEQQ